jgi:uncharacterized protein YecE (DUF72 family)
VAPAEVQRAHQDLAGDLPPELHLGTSSWSYPGWTGHVWAQDVGEALLSRHGLPAYCQHPLLRTVSVDRAFYRALTVSQYAAYAAQVPDDFRFIVKAPSSVCDALVRNDKGRALQHNPVFLDAAIAEQEFIRPALQGLRHKVGALVFQISPLPPEWLRERSKLLRHLHDMLCALPSIKPEAADGVIAVEFRDAAMVAPELMPELVAMLREVGATYCLGLHAKMPPVEDQLPIFRALWPGPLVARWNLHRRHGAYGYEDARAMYAPFNRIQDADEETRQTLARVIAGTTGAGHKAYVSVSNKAEGCAPLSVALLAQAARDEAQRLARRHTP